jgi:hypothetical protein
MFPMKGFNKQRFMQVSAKIAVTIFTMTTLSTGALAATKPQIDGKLAAGEYQHRYQHSASGVEINWTVVGDTIYFGIDSPSTGWTGIGFSGAGPKKKGADLIMWAVENGELTTTDQFVPAFPIPKADTSQGGKDDIIQKAGVETKSGTVVEFARKLATGDKYDNDITDGSMKVMLALGDQDNLTKAHKPSQRWEFTLDLLK